MGRYHQVIPRPFPAKGAWRWPSIQERGNDFNVKGVIIIVLILGGFLPVKAEEYPKLHPVRTGKKFGYVNEQGSLVIPDRLDWAWPFTEARAGVRVGKDWFLLDEKGQRVSSERYDWIGCFSQGLAPARLGKKWGYVGRDGSWKIEPYFSDARPFREGVAAVQVGGFYDIVDKTSSFDGVEGMDFCPPIGDRQVPGSSGGKWGLIDRHGKYVREPDLDEILEARQSRIPFRSGCAWGFLTVAGNVVVPSKYLAVSPFQANLAKVTLFNGRTGFLNLAGEFSESQLPLWRPAEELATVPTASGK